jgi:hypothetical protein
VPTSQSPRCAHAHLVLLLVRLLRLVSLVTALSLKHRACTQLATRRLLLLPPLLRACEAPAAAWSRLVLLLLLLRRGALLLPHLSLVFAAHPPSSRAGKPQAVLLHRCAANSPLDGLRLGAARRAATALARGVLILSPLLAFLSIMLFLLLLLLLLARRGHACIPTAAHRLGLHPNASEPPPLPLACLLLLLLLLLLYL